MRTYLSEFSDNANVILYIIQNKTFANELIISRTQSLAFHIAVYLNKNLSLIHIYN